MSRQTSTVGFIGLLTSPWIKKSPFYNLHLRARKSFKFYFIPFFRANYHVYRICMRSDILMRKMCVVTSYKIENHNADRIKLVWNCWEISGKLFM